MATEREQQQARNTAYEIEKAGRDPVESILIPFWPSWQTHEDHKDPDLTKAQQQGIDRARNER